MSWTPPTIPKPAKPASSFFHPGEPYPLVVNGCGYYSKRIHDHVFYFARWDEGAQEAERRYRERFRECLHRFCVFSEGPVPAHLTSEEQSCWRLYLLALECGEPGMDKATPLGAFEWLRRREIGRELPKVHKWTEHVSRAKRFYDNAAGEKGGAA